MTTLLNACRVTPPPRHTTEEKLVQLSHMDIFWLHFLPIRSLLFYKHPNCSKAHFLEIIIPQLKQSLSITLKDYLPVAGNLLYPLNPEKKPIIRYRVGDSVSLTFAESSYDFDELTGNHAKDADQFYDFVPQLPPFEDEPDYKIAPVLALQVTLFPDRGICIGIAHYHCLGDASSIASFIRAWAANNKLGGDEEFLFEKSPSLPIFDRSLIVDPLGINTLYWNVKSQIPIKPSSFPLPTNRVRATYTLHLTDIKQLKELVLARKPGVAHVSSFVVTVSYIWTCLVKSGDAAGEEVDENILERLIFAVDARARMNPPVPASYFGNCLGFGRVTMEHKEMVQGEAFLIAAEAVAEHIKNRVNNKDELFKGAENWLSRREECMWMRNVGVAGSPKFDMTSADFGWGTAKKMEVVSLGGEKYSISLCKSRDSGGGLEVGLSLPKERMEAFAAMFAEGLRSLVG